MNLAFCSLGGVEKKGNREREDRLCPGNLYTSSKSIRRMTIDERGARLTSDEGDLREAAASGCDSASEQPWRQRKRGRSKRVRPQNRGLPNG